MKNKVNVKLVKTPKAIMCIGKYMVGWSENSLSIYKSLEAFFMCPESRHKLAKALIGSNYTGEEEAKESRHKAAPTLLNVRGIREQQTPDGRSKAFKRALAVEPEPLTVTQPSNCCIRQSLCEGRILLS